MTRPCVLLLLCPEHSGAQTLADALGRRGWTVADTAAPELDTLHRRLLARPLVVLATDARPEAAELAADKLTDDDQAELERWLAAQLTAAPDGRLVVRDPRTLWFVDLWRDAVATLDGDLRVALVLRHPVAVARTAMAPDESDAEADDDGRHDLIAGVAGWCQTTLTAEETSADDRRAVVRTDDVRSEPDRALAELAEHLGLELDPPSSTQAPETAGPAAADGVPSTDDLTPRLRDVAVRLWSALTPGPVDADALTGLREAYDRLHDDAVAIAADHTRTREIAARRRARAAARSEYASQVAELEQQLEEAHGARDVRDDVDDEVPFPRR